MKKIKLQLVLLSLSIISFSQTRIYSVIGSSTAAGLGASVPDSSWVNRLTYYYTRAGLLIEPHNLGVSGRNCYHGMPSWYTPPAGRDYPLVNENITKALSFNPEVVILNYPSNNFNYYTIAEILNCLQTMKDAANAAGKTCYITTSQPRMDANFPDFNARLKLKTIRDSIIRRFGNYAIDFFTDLADPVTYQILPIYSYGDGIHFNDRGHALLFEKVKAKNIFNAAPPPTGCSNILASAISGGITVSGLSAPVVGVQVFNNSWASVYNQTFTNSPGAVTIPSLVPGTYHVTTSCYTSSWSPVCNKSQDVIVQSSSPPPPPPPSSPNCNNITMSSISGGIAFTGLAAPIVAVQIFSNNWISIYNQSYNNSPGNVSVTSLAQGTYHAKVTFSTSSYGYICEKMQDVVVQTSTPPPTGSPNCNTVSFTAIASGIQLKGLVAPIVSVQVFNNNWISIYNQSFSNSPDIVTLNALVPGTYHAKVSFSTSAYSFICERMQDVVVNGGGMNANWEAHAISERSNEFTVMGIRCFLNPFSGAIRLEINAAARETGNLTLFDAFGRKLFSRGITIERGNNKFILDGSAYAPGNYFLRYNGNKIETIKLVKR